LRGTSCRGQSQRQMDQEGEKAAETPK